MTAQFRKITMTKRKAHEVEVRRKITKVARRLFQDQGYNQTTIRQITQAAEVKTGSLYHFYKDKEDIFSTIVREVFYRVVERTNELVPAEQLLLQSACELSWHIHSMLLDEQTAELYVVTYNSPRISAAILADQVQRSLHLFGAMHPGFREEDHRLRAMFVKGFLQATALRISNGEAIELHPTVEKAVQLMFRLYDIPPLDIQQVLRRLPDLPIEELVRQALAGEVVKDG